MNDRFTGGLARRLGAAALAVVLVTAPHAAPAQGLLGRLFDRTAEEEDVVGVPQPYEVEFVVVDDEEIETALRNASRLWIERDEPASGAAGLIARARADYHRILNALYGEARYGGTISITIDGQEATTLLPDADLAVPAMVRVTVDPGPLFHFSEARIVNQAPPAVDPDDAVADPAEEGFRVGETARSGVIVRAGRLAVEAWRQQGHPKAELVDQRIVAAHDTNTIEATLTVEPGAPAVFGTVSVRGTERMDPAFVARQTGITPGTEYDPDDLDAARERLARLDVFSVARLEEAEEIGADGSLPIQVIVQERLPRRIGVGGSYSTLDGFGLEAFWLHRNLFGRAERLRIEGNVSGIDSVDPRDYTYRLGGTFTRPGIYTPDTDFVASVFGEREVLDAYTRTGVTARMGFTQRFSDTFSSRVFLTGSHARFEDDVFGRRDFTTVGVEGSVIYDTRDEPADATSGIYAELTLHPFYEFNYGNVALRAVAEGRAYYSLDAESRYVLAGRARIGTLLDPPVAETPPDRLFFAGGGGSVRGYAYRNIGVETPAGLIGGRSLIEGSAELRVRVTESIGVVGFVDAGYVGEDALPRFTEDLRVGVGAGLRYQTGFGPIRLDVAMPLDRGPGDPRVALYVGIGQAF